MTIATAPADATSPAQSRPRRRWTDAEFDRLVESGVIREGSPAFLWDGEVIDPMAEDYPHLNAVFHLFQILMARLVPADWTVNQNLGIELVAGYRPQPDLSVVRGPRSSLRARGARPRPADVALLVEVSDTTYLDDSNEYLRKYAEVGISRYWIVNIQARTVEVYNGPDPESLSYRVRVVYSLDETVPLTLDVGGVATDLGAIAVRDILRDSLED